MDKLMRLRAKKNKKKHTIRADTFPFLGEPPP